MDKNSSMYKTVLLGCVCAVAGVLLAIVNSITAPVIAENAIANVKKNLIEIYPDVDDFKDISSDCLKDDESGLIDAVYQAGDEGYIFSLHNTGYSSDGFTFLIGFNKDGSVSGYTVLSQKETAGKGSLCFEGDYVDEVKKLTADDDMPIISGATITSQAVNQAVKAAEKVFTTLK